MPSKEEQMLRIARDPVRFTRAFNNIELRPYQAEVMRAILDSVFHHRGMAFVIIFARQSGKDEMLANLIIYLLTRLREQDASIVCAQPTFKPQTINAMERLLTRLERPWFRNQWKRSGGYIFRMGKATCTYFSAEATANVVGATARTLLIINEAQDVEAAIYDKRFAPMAAAGNATRIFSGTSWTSNTLLSRELRMAQEASRQDGIQRAFIVPGEEVGRCNPFYATHMNEQVMRFGRDHPLIKTQYFCEEIEAKAGMFPPGRQALMHGRHSRQIEPEAGKRYAFLVDVAGQDEEGAEALGDSYRLPPEAGLRPARAVPGIRSPAGDSCHRQADGCLEDTRRTPYTGGRNERDSTVLKIVEIDTGTVEMLGKPTYKAVYRKTWRGEKHVKVFGAIRALAEGWKPRKVVVDATGVGEGLWSLLENALGAEVVVGVKFTRAVKSELGYGFLSIVESGRYLEYSPFDAVFKRQLDKCNSEIVPGPAHLMRWGVPDGMKDPVRGELVHDDDLMSSALCYILDGFEWRVSMPTVIIPGVDPLEEMDRNF